MVESKKAKIWVVTKEVNDYNQYGDYFIAVWQEKPTIAQIKGCLGCSEELAEHIFNGGGRIDYEGRWYNLLECEQGCSYEEKD